MESKIKRLEAAIDQYYYEDVDDEDLEQGLYKGLLEGVGDTYTAYYTNCKDSQIPLYRITPPIVHLVSFNNP